MTQDLRRILLTILLMMTILVIWAKVTMTLYPAPQRDEATATAEGVPSPGDVGQRMDEAAPSAMGESDLFEPVTEALSEEPILLGIDAPRNADPPNPYLLALRLTPRGAAVESVNLTDHRNTVARRRGAPPDNYNLMSPILDPVSGRMLRSLVTERIHLVEQQVEIDLSDVVWSVERGRDGAGEFATFQTQIKQKGQPVLAIAKTYRVGRDSRMVRMDLSVANLTDEPHSIIVTQGGPLGFRKEDIRYDDRHAYVSIDSTVPKAQSRGDVWKQDHHRKDFLQDQAPIGWAAVGNKYFACMMGPLSQSRATDETAEAPPRERPDFVRKASVRTMVNAPRDDLGDLSVEWYVAPPEPLAAGQTFQCAFDVYMGPRDERILAADPRTIRHDFALICMADRSPCTFEWLSRLMLALMRWLHRVLPGVHNYGWTIIVLVLIVRTILHPITKRQQIHMTRMQKSMAALQPKLEALKQKYANDRQMLNQATLDLYRREGVNPAGSMLSCLPLMLQMPIWVALWSMLNSSIELRHEPFHLWIRDLASPDALYTWGQAFHIPLLGALTGPLQSLNILPLIMGLTMYLQVKYTQKLTRPDKPPPPSSSGKPGPLDQMAMQQKMMSYMSIFFVLMFYNFPSGLNLYILTSNVFGIVEQYRIRKHIRDQDARGQFEPPAPGSGKKTPGWLDKLEKLQKKAEQARQIRSKPVRR